MSEDHGHEAHDTSDGHVHEPHEVRHEHATVERIETVSSTSTPWGLRLAFGFGGMLLLAGAFVAWQFRDALGGSVGEALPWLIAAAVLIGAGAIIESVTVEVWVTLIVGVFALAVTFVIAGRVSTYPSQGQSIFVVDRFSGEVEAVHGDWLQGTAARRRLSDQSAIAPASVAAQQRR